jgi:hypothetical protein
MSRAFWDAARELDPEAPDEATMRPCSPAELEALWRGAGRRDVEVGELVCSAEYEGLRRGSPERPFALRARAWFARGVV